MSNIKTATENLAISSDELKASLEAKDKPIVFDLGNMDRYEARHIPGSAYTVCNEDSKKNIMPRLPKDIEIILVSDDEEYPKHMAIMMSQMGLKVRYLKGGLDSWKWSFQESVEKDITANELKKSLDASVDLFLLDVREPDEFADWNIEGSQNIALGDLSRSLDKIPRNMKIIAICPHGNRSKIAKFILQSYGYDVQCLEGGLKAWSTALEHAVNDFNISGNKVQVIPVKRIGKGCTSYIVSSGGEAAVIDPVFPVDYYLNLAREYNIHFTRVYDTHHHADHVSAAKQLADKSGADLYLSSYEEYSFTHKPLLDADIHTIGNIKLEVIHTPGHTMGGISFLLGGKILFTGDTLFVNGVGRPDLRDKSHDFAAALYDSLHNKILNLDETTVVYPAHVETNIRRGELMPTTLGMIKESNRSLLFLDRDRFIQTVTMNITKAPKSYKEIISINKYNSVPSSINEIHELEIGPNRCNISM
ncbi:MAG: MBL fold metallo-hydrolase [Nitrosopumilales archaeon]|nr:MAG: MBL fold metallo-hydrolase [Nitrosopumilales archaeon]